MKSTQAVLRGKDTAIERALYIGFELSDKAWKLSFSDGQRTPGRFSVPAGEQSAVLECIARAKARCKLPPDAPVHTCYEAGRDGWWPHRWLKEQGVDNIVVDSSSIEVNRRARRAKTDRLDGDKLLAMLLRYLAGERRVWAVVHEPTPQAEDERRVHRELPIPTASAPCWSCITCGLHTWAGATGRSGGRLTRRKCGNSWRADNTPWSVG
jgi:transposase